MPYTNFKSKYHLQQTTTFNFRDHRTSATTSVPSPPQNSLTPPPCATVGSLNAAPSLRPLLRPRTPHYRHRVYSFPVRFERFA
ncbi:hypothetical protein HanRHA438_Chr08g0345191 [Helianthus annuus]|nr:hypothetical protein HanRHA438_Chr08g0345191 [Helianthus annuus]